MFFFSIIVTWLSCLLIIELLSLVDSNNFISILVLSLLIIVVSISDLSLDLLALTTLIAFLVTLSFILIILVSLEGTNKNVLHISNPDYSSIFIFFISLILVMSLLLSTGFSSWLFSLRWLDLYSTLSISGSSIVSILHFLSTRFYLLDFCLLNVWIVFILLISLFCLFYLWTNSNSLSSHISTGSSLKSISNNNSSASQL